MQIVVKTWIEVSQAVRFKDETVQRVIEAHKSVIDCQDISEARDIEHALNIIPGRSAKIMVRVLLEKGTALITLNDAEFMADQLKMLLSDTPKLNGKGKPYSYSDRDLSAVHNFHDFDRDDDEPRVTI